jgi:hypothetical protein
MPIHIKSNIPSPAQARCIVNEERRKALTDAARYVRAKAAKYPPKPSSSTYRRTGTLGRSITISTIHQVGHTVWAEVGTNLHYAPYVEYGTGIYGPRGVPITPKTAKVLAWRATAGALQRAGRPGHLLIAMDLTRRKGKLRRSQRHDIYLIFARSVKGFPGWHFMEKAFTAPDTQAYFQQRLVAMMGAIQQRLTAGG